MKITDLHPFDPITYLNDEEDVMGYLHSVIEENRPKATAAASLLRLPLRKMGSAIVQFVFSFERRHAPSRITQGFTPAPVFSLCSVSSAVLPKGVSN